MFFVPIILSFQQFQRSRSKVEMAEFYKPLSTQFDSDFLEEELINNHRKPLWRSCSFSWQICAIMLLSCTNLLVLINNSVLFARHPEVPYDLGKLRSNFMDLRITINQYLL